jgi:hypothetical protein
LTRLSKTIDNGQIRTTLAEVLGPINPANLTGARNSPWSGTRQAK